MSETNSELNQEIEKLEELKEYATEIGTTFRENIGLAKLEVKVAEREEEIAKRRKEEKEAKKVIDSKKVKIVIEPRDRDDNVHDQFFGLNSLATGIKETIRIQFGEEVDVSLAMYNHIVNIRYSEKKFKLEMGEDGQQKKKWYDKKQTRFIVAKV